MNDPAIEPTEAPKTPAKRKYTRRKAAPRKVATEERAAPKEAFPGLTRTVCADACNASGCVISGNVYCAHPTKGGLQASDMSNADAIKRMQRAREQLQVRIDPDRFK